MSNATWNLIKLVRENDDLQQSATPAHYVKNWRSENRPFIIVDNTERGGALNLQEELALHEATKQTIK